MASVKIVLGAAEERLPAAVVQAAVEAALAVVANYRRTGTACGHVAWRDTDRCLVMACGQYAGHGGGGL